MNKIIKQGGWESAPQKGIPGHCTMAQVFDKEGKALIAIEPRIKQDEATDIAKLVAAAPELLEALKFCQSVIKSQSMFDVSERMAFDKAQEAIKKAI